jgi:hypothetical protein
MIAALATLPFALVLWLLLVTGASILEQSGGKIAAALRGEPRREPCQRTPRIRTRSVERTVSSSRAQLRAAA